MPDQQQQHPQASSFASNLTRDISPSQLQNHLYTAFLQQATPDVALRIRGSWRAIYNLHRVVLIQAVRSLLFPPTHNPIIFYSLFLRAFSNPSLQQVS